METQQPVWKLIGHVGDVNPLDYDGGHVYADTTGVYSAELEWIQAQDDGGNEAGPWKVYRWALDRCEAITRGDSTLLVPYGFSSRTDLPYPLESYDEWFNRDLANVCGSMDVTPDTFRENRHAVPLPAHGRRAEH